MHGFYNVKFHSGYQTYVAVKKTAKSPIIAVLPNKYYVDESTKEIIEVYDSGNIANIQGGRLTIQEYFNSFLVKCELTTLDVNFDWRK